MTYSPFLARFAALAGAQRDADRLGIDVAELTGRCAEFASTDRGLTRRELMKRAVVAGAGATVAGQLVLNPTKAFGASGPASQPTIAIVGAGISGMTAAMTLKDAGFRNVTVYESSDSVGGRTYTRKNDGFWDAGQWSEWGGELIDSNHKLIFTLCQRFGFGVTDLQWHSVSTNGAEDVLWFDNGYYAWADMVADWKEGGVDKAVTRDIQTLPAFPWAYSDPTWTLAARGIDDMSLYDWIETRIPGGHSSRLGRFIDVAYNIEYGEETSRQGAIGLLSLLGYSNGNGGGAFWVYGKSDERWKIIGGNQQITLAQADFLGWQNVQLGWRLTAVRLNTNGTVTAIFDVGRTSRSVTADRIVLALPLGVMKRIKTAGGFDQAFGGNALKMGFIDALGFGANNKLQLQIADRFWAQPGQWGNSNGEAYGDRGFQLVWHVTAGQPGTRGIINNYTGGDVSRLLNPSKPFSDTSDSSSRDRAYVRQAAQAFLAQIEPVFPGMTARWTGKATLSAWHKSTNHYGAYSYWTPGYMQRYSTAEAPPVGAIHFAGEHTSSSFQGYIQGGAEQGQRAANEIVAAY
jgi:monoamine oxidase